MGERRWLPVADERERGRYQIVNRETGKSRDIACVCVCEREREREPESQRAREPERQRESKRMTSIKKLGGKRRESMK